MTLKEQIARELCGRLSLVCPGGTEVALEGNGTYCNCIARRADRYCSMAVGLRDGAPEFLCYYRIGVGIDAMGRPTSVEETAHAAARWMLGASVAEMEGQFAFVNAPKKALLAIKDGLAARTPEILSTRIDLNDRGMCAFNLAISNGDRRCIIDFREGEPTPRIQLTWYELTLSTFHTADLNLLAQAVKRWVCDAESPSSLRAAFPAIEISAAADCFEMGRRVEGEFVLSWDHVEAHYRRGAYRDLPSTFIRPADKEAVRAFLSALRRAGYDRILRAGTSHYTLVLSRSHEHGWHAEQQRVALDFTNGTLKARSNGSVVLLESPIALTAELDSNLRSLAENPID